MVCCARIENGFTIYEAALDGGSTKGEQYWSMVCHAEFCGLEFVKCLFVSPVLDMEKLIQNMMQWAAVSEERLETESLIPTDFGETLSWDYYKYAKAHPVAEWQCGTDILYAEHDQMTSRDPVTDFAERFHASLTVMKDGEHWFHTPEQVDVMDKWTEACL